MALRVGDKAPFFELPSTGGGKVSLESLKGQRFALYFYPKDFTSICTKQACAFRDGFSRLRDLDTKVFGVNQENLDTHRRFKEAHALPFDLLSDRDGSVAKAYKARVPLIGLTKRITYLIDGDGVVRLVHDEMLGDASHLKAVLDGL